VAGRLIDRDQFDGILAEIGLQKFVGLFVPTAVLRAS
jgi:hypothetical protein